MLSITNFINKKIYFDIFLMPNIKKFITILNIYYKLLKFINSKIYKDYLRKMLFKF